MEDEAIQINLEASSATSTLVITNNNFSNWQGSGDGFHLEFGASSSSNHSSNVLIQGNTIDGADGKGIRFEWDGGNTTVFAIINDNTITGGAATEDGIFMSDQSNGDGGANIDAFITGNTFLGTYSENGIYVRPFNLNASPTNTLNIVIDDNDVAAPNVGANFAAIHISDDGSSSSDHNYTLNVEVTNNDVTGYTTGGCIIIDQAVGATVNYLESGNTGCTATVAGTADPDPVPSTSSLGTIGNFVWEDLNQNGIQDSGEPGIAGVQIAFTDSSSVSGTTVTNSAGFYTIPSLPEDTYTLRLTLPAGFVSLSPKDQTGETLDSDFDVNTFQVTVTLAAGFNDTTIDAGLSKQPGCPVITFTTSKNDESCINANDGSITISNPAGGTTPYAYSIDGVSFSNQTNYNGLSDGMYVVTVRDSAGCTAVDTVMIIEPSPVTFTTTVVDVSCPGASDGSVSITNTMGGAGPYEYANDGLTFSSTASFSGLPEGQQIITVRDFNGCEFADTVMVSVGPDSVAPVLSCPTGTVTLGNDPGICAATYTFSISATDDCGGFPTLADFEPPVVYNGNGYYLSTIQLGGPDAIAYAANLGGHLVAINDTGENRFVADLTSSPILIGLTDEMSEGNFVWTNGDPVNFTSWDGGEPNNAGGAEDYTEIKSGSSLLWKDIRATTTRRFVIEVPAGTLPIQVSEISGNVFPVGSRVISATVVDAAANADSCSWTLVVNDTMPVTIECPSADTIITCDGSPIVYDYTETVAYYLGDEHDAFLRTYNADFVEQSNIFLNFANGNITNIIGLAVHPTTDVLYGVVRVNFSDRYIVTINPGTGIASPLSNPGINFSDITFDNAGTLYAVSGRGGSNNNSLFTINTADGTATLVSDSIGSGDGHALAFNSDNGLLYHMYNCGSMESIDPANAFDTTNIPFQNLHCMVGMTYDNGFLIATSTGNFVYQIGLTGNSTTLSTSIVDAGSIERFTPPEINVIDNCSFTLSQIAGPPSGSMLSPGLTTFAYTATDLGGFRDTCTWSILVFADTAAPVISCPSDTIIIACDTIGTVYDYAQSGFILAGHKNDNIVWVYDEATQAFLFSGSISAPGISIENNHGFALNPLGDSVYAIVSESINSNIRYLVSFDPTNFQGNLKGRTTEFADITFDANGTLYGVSEENDSLPHRLFTIDLMNGAVTLIDTLGEGEEHALAFNPEDGLLYHLYDLRGFESIDPNNGFSITQLPLPVNPTEEPLSLDYFGNNTFIAAGDGPTSIYTLTADGTFSSAEFIDIPDEAGGLAYVPNPNVLAVFDDCDFTLTLLSGFLNTDTLLLNTTNTATWVATDANGNSDTCSFSVIPAVDPFPPTISCPADTVITACDAAGVSYAYDVTHSDNCDPDGTILIPQQLAGIASDSLFPIGVTMNSWAVVDGFGNADTCSFMVTVVPDTTDPMLTCPGDTTIVSCDGSSVVYDYDQPTEVVYAGDRCCELGLYTLAWPGLAVERSVVVIVPGIPNSPEVIFGLAQHPQTGVLYAVVGEDQGGSRYLITVDPTTGLGTLIGLTGIYVSDISFGADGTLYAISGQGGGLINTLHSLNLSTGAATPLFTMGDGGGKAMAFNPDDGCVYHYFDSGDEFEKINLTTGDTTDIPLSGVDFGSGGAMTYIGGGEFLIIENDDTEAYIITTAGVISDAAGTFLQDPASVEYAVRTALPTEDACAVTLNLLGGPASDSALALGSYTVSYEAVDQSGNSATCSWNVSVIGDTAAPVFTGCPSDTLIVSCSSDSVVYDYARPTEVVYAGERCCGMSLYTLTWPDLTEEQEVTVSVAGIPISPDVIFGLAQHPQTGVLYAVIGEDEDDERYLITVDPTTGTGTVIGLTGIYVSDISFGSDGTLYAMSGQGGNVSHTLHTLDLVSGFATALYTAGDGGGKAMAFNPDDGFVYHYYDGGSEFEKIDLNTGDTTTIPLSGTNFGSGGAMTYIGGGEFLIIENNDTDAYIITTVGVVSDLPASFPEDPASVEYVVRTELPVSDECGVTLNFISGPPSGSTLALGDYTITYQAEDPSGNTSTCTWNASVITDTIPPKFVNCPENDTILDCGGSGLTYDFPFGYDDIFDDCSGATIMQTMGPASGSLLASPSTTIFSFTATDTANSSLTSTCTWTVVVEADTVPPVVECPSDTILLACDTFGLPFTYGQVPVYYAGDHDNGVFRTRDTSAFRQLSQLPLSLPGFLVDQVYGLALHPKTGVLYAVVGSQSNPRPLVILDPNTGAMTLIGTPAVYISDLTFDDEGTLYGVTGNGGAAPNQSLVTIDLQTGAISLVTAVGTGRGHALAFNPDDGLLYHLHNQNDFESIDPANGFARTDIGLTGANDEMTSLTYIGNGIFRATDSDDEAYDITTTGQSIIIASGFEDISAIEFADLPLFPATDHCDFTITQIAGLASGDTFPIGVTPMQFRATDASGQTTDCNFNVTVVPDTIQPEVFCPDDITVLNDFGESGAIVDYEIGISDNCLTTEISDDFDGPSIDPRWIVEGGFPAGLCGSVSGANALYFNGEDERTATLNNLNLAAGGRIEFFLKLAVGGSGPCEDADQPDEGVILESSLDNGVNWSPVFLFDVGLYGDFTPFSILLNGAFAGNNVSLRFRQPDNTGSSFDNWAIDDFELITTNNPGITINQPAGLPSGSLFPIGTTTLTFSATDSVGNPSDPCSFEITVLDVIVPELICPSTIQAECNDSTIDIAAFIAAGGDTMDNCSVDPGTLSMGAADVISNQLHANHYDVLRTYVIDDIHGNTSLPCTSTIEVRDTQAPNAVCQNITVYVDNSGNATISASDVDGGSTDNCTLDSLAVSKDAFGCGDGGPNAVTLTVFDLSLNSDTCVATVTVLDTLDPTPVCQDITIYLDNAGNASITETDVDNGSFDNCGSVSLMIDSTDFDCGETGANTVVLTVTDSSGNSSSCTSVVTVLDTLAPTAVCQSTQVYLNSMGSASVIASELDGGSMDNCGHSLVFSVDSASALVDCSQLGVSTAILLTVSDASGNTDTCTASFMVLDTLAPIVTCPAPVIVANDSGVCGASVSLLATVSDNCGGAAATATSPVTTYNSISSGAADTTVLAIPVSGLPSASGATLVVSARGDLDLQIPFDDERFDILGEDGTLLGTTNNTPANCDVDYTTTMLSLTAAQLNAWGADGTVDIVLAPRQVGSIFTFCAGGSDAFASLDYTAGPSASNSYNAGGLDASDFYPVGNTTVTFQVQDASGNMDSCTVVVVVNDTTAPTAICCDLTVYLDANGAVSISASQVDSASTDNCSVASIALDSTAFDCGETGPNTVTLTVTDSSGNASTCASIITVLHTISPTIAFCPDPIVVCENDTVTYLTPTFDDNCGGMGLDGMLQTGLASGSVFPLGISYAVWTYSDPSGNVSPACSVMVTVNIRPIAPNTSAVICSDDMVGFDLQAHIDANGNAVNSNFVWQANAVPGISGIATSPQAGDTITDQLVNLTTNPRTVVYTVTPTSDPEGCSGPSFTITVVVNPSAQFGVLPIDICPGDLANLAGAIRDYSLLARVAVFYDAHPDSGGNVIAQAPMFRGTVRRTVRVLVSPPVSTTYYVTGITAQGCTETLPINVVVGDPSRCSGTIAPIALLEGAWDAATGTQRTTLQQQGLLPPIEPYTALGYTFRGGGGEMINMPVHLQQQVVDWVIIELHDANDSVHATYSRAALLMADGRIVDTDGVSPPAVVANPAKGYYLVVLHRNHLGLMTGQPIQIGSTVDFSDPNTATFGIGNSRVIINGKAYLYAGDANGDGQIQNTDDVLEWMPNAGTSGYKGADYNLDGQVQNSDRVFMWLRNVGRGTAVPE
jgi:uncharacterized protein YjiK